MSRLVSLAIAALAVFAIFSSAASATETITYTYDARGRLIRVVHTGTVNNNNQACYTYDKADNRTNVKVDIGSQQACPSAAGSGSDPAPASAAQGFLVTFFGTYHLVHFTVAE